MQDGAKDASAAWGADDVWFRSRHELRAGL